MYESTVLEPALKAEMYGVAIESQPSWGLGVGLSALVLREGFQGKGKGHTYRLSIWNCHRLSGVMRGALCNVTRRSRSLFRISAD